MRLPFPHEQGFDGTQRHRRSGGYGVHLTDDAATLQLATTLSQDALYHVTSHVLERVALLIIGEL